MTKSFMQMVEEAMEHVDGIDPSEAQERLAQDRDALIVDVRDASDIPSTGLAPRSLNISLGMLPLKADHDMPEMLREAQLQDRSRQIILTCQMGANAARGAALLKEMGFSNVCYMKGGMMAWKSAGLPIETSD